MADRFETTHWSLVQAAGDSAHPDSREALSRLCQAYWPAIYAYVRRRGNDPDSARDLTQGFFTQLLDKKSLKAARPERGRFRSFLLASVDYYMTNEWHRARTQRRGGGVDTLQLDFDSAESTLGLESVEHLTPEAIFEKRWAHSVLRQAMDRLQDEMSVAGKSDQFRRLKPYLTSAGAAVPYKELAHLLGMGESAVRVAIHRFRQRFGGALRNEVAQTLSDPALLDDEMKFLLGALGS